MKKSLAFILSCLPFLSYGQDAYTLKFLPQVHQSQWSNASNQTDAKISIGLPVISGTSFSFYNSGFTYHELFHKIDENTTSIRPGEFIDRLKDKNLINIGANISLISVNVALPDFSVGFSVNDKIDMRFNYPKDLFKFFWYGNGAYIGKTLDIGSFALNASWYREYALHGTKNYKKWTFGASPKLLFGKVNINTRESSLKITTAEDFYAISANTKMNVETSGFSDSTDKALGNDGIDAVGSKNMGFGIDLGAKYQVNDQIAISAGVNNLGSIKWNNKVHNFTAGPSSFTFDGFNGDNLFKGDTSILSTSQFLDSIKNTIKFDKNSAGYKTALPYELFVMGTYALTEKHSFGAQLNAQRFNKKFVFAGTLYYQLTLSEHFSGSLSYTAKSNSFFNLGMAIVARFSPVQFYFATDNWWASIKPLDSKNVNLHMGINLAIGNKDKSKK